VFFDLALVTRRATTSGIGIEQQDGFGFAFGAWLLHVSHCGMRVVGTLCGRVRNFHRAQFTLRRWKV
jgi:hypothetical protein